MAINGTLILVDKDGTALASTTDATLNVNLDTPDASTKDSAGWQEVIAGQKSWSIDVDGLATFDYSTSEAGQGTVMRLVEDLRNRTSVAVKFLPDSGVTYYGNAYVSSISVGAPNEDVSTISGSFTGNGPLNVEETT
jgi:TP901-1 family phage major tail protein